MNKRILWSRILCFAGLALIAVGEERAQGIPVHYVACLLAANGLVVLGALCSRIRHRALVYGAFGFEAIVMASRIVDWVWTTQNEYVLHGLMCSYVRDVGDLPAWASIAAAAVVVLESLRASVPESQVVARHTSRHWWSGTMSLAGFAMIATGLAPLVIPEVDIPGGDLFVLLLIGSGLAALGAPLGTSRYRKFLYAAFGVTACGLAADILMLSIVDTSLGGTIGTAPLWVIVACLTQGYIVGPVMAAVGAAYVAVDSFRATHAHFRVGSACTALITVLLVLEFPRLEHYLQLGSSIGDLEQRALDIQCLTINPITPTTVYAVTLRGVVRSSDAGEHWGAVGPQDGLLSLVVVDPRSPSTLYAAGESSVYRSIDRGDHWRAVSTGLPGYRVNCLAIDPRTPTTLYAGTEGNHVYGGTDGSSICRSRDSGAHWTAASNGMATNEDILCLAVDPKTPTTLYAGAESLFRSTDAGDHWQAVSHVLRAHQVVCLAIDPITPTTVYAVWDTGVFRSADGGDHWEAISTGLTGEHVFCLAVDPKTPMTLYAGTGESVFRSTDAGDHWEAISTGIAAGDDVHCLAIDPQIPTTLYAGTSGSGVFRSTDRGGHWEAISTGLTEAS